MISRIGRDTYLSLWAQKPLIAAKQNTVGELSTMSEPVTPPTEIESVFSPDRGAVIDIIV